jgi:hypothetical protein
MPYNYFDLMPPGLTLPGPPLIGPMFPAKQDVRRSQSRRAGSRDNPEEPPAPCEAANYAAQAALYAENAEVYASALAAIAAGSQRKEDTVL